MPNSNTDRKQDYEHYEDYERADIMSPSIYSCTEPLVIVPIKDSSTHEVLYRMDVASRKIRKSAGPTY